VGLLFLENNNYGSNKVYNNIGRITEQVNQRKYYFFSMRFECRKAVSLFL